MCVMYLYEINIVEEPVALHIPLKQEGLFSRDRVANECVVMKLLIILTLFIISIIINIVVNY